MNPPNKGWQGGPWGSGGGSSGGRPSGGGSNRPTGRGPQDEPPRDFDAWVQRLQQQWQDWFGGDDGRNGLGLAALLALLLWMATGIYSVGPDEQGVVTRFGAFHRTTGSGLQYHLPYPLEQVQTPKVTAANQVEIGFRSGGVRGNSVPEESLMLTGDENIVDVNFVVQWKIRDAGQFLFNVKDPRETIKAVSESAMREVIGKSDVATVLSSGDGKLQIELGTRQLIQQTLDVYKAGVIVEKVNMGKAEPPGDVIEAFRDVQRAQTDQERARNEAEAYRNDIIPRARGQAEQMIQDAEAYREQVVATAEGDVARFLAVQAQYKNAPAVTRERMYLETMEAVLTAMPKVILEGKGSQGVLPFMALPGLAPKPAEEVPPTEGESR